MSDAHGTQTIPPTPTPGAPPPTPAAPTPDLAALGTPTPAALPDPNNIPTPPDPSAPPAPVPAAPPADEAATVARGLQARIDTLTAEKWEARRGLASRDGEVQRMQGEIDALNARLAALPPATPPDPNAPPPTPGAPPSPDAPVYTQAQLEARARELAAGMTSRSDTQAAFDSAVNTALAEGKAAHGAEFDASIAALRRFGPLPPYFVDAVLKAGQGGDAKAHDILHALGKDSTMTDQLLSMPPIEVAVAVTRYAGKLTPASKTQTAPPVSAAPPPVKTQVPGNNNGGNPQDLSNPNLSTAEWLRLRDQQIKAQNEARG